MAASKKKRGFFITFEGGEGSGKSSQIKRLMKELDKSNVDYILTREPGGSPGGEAVRHVLLSGAAESFGPEMEAILFSAARSDNVETIIKPALEKGTHVICDRFFDSTRVYQGVAGKADMKLLKSLERVACEGAWPDLTLILDIDPKEGLARAAKRRGVKAKPDRFEKENLTLQRKRRKAYLDITKQEPERCVVIDGSGAPSQVFSRIRKALHERLGLLPPSSKRKTRKKTVTRTNAGKNDAGNHVATHG